MTTNSPTASGHVTIVFTSDWGVSTGVGHAGRTHSTIERCGDDPVVRGTVITGVLREQAMLAAKALDGPTKENEKGKWTGFARWLFGQDPDSEPGSTPHPRHVLFSDATPASKIPIHDTVSLSIDPKTGTARDQFLRFTERAAAGVLTGTFTLIDEAEDEDSIQRTIEAAHFLLGVAGLMVRGIGSGRSGGDGECTVLVTNHEVEARDGKSTSKTVAFASSCAQELRTSLRKLAQSLKPEVVSALPAPQRSTQHQVGRRRSRSSAQRRAPPDPRPHAQLAHRVLRGPLLERNPLLGLPAGNGPAPLAAPAGVIEEARRARSSHYQRRDRRPPGRLRCVARHQ